MGKVYKRRVSSYDAAHCEAAHAKRCRCRCGGVLHGISHSRFVAAEAEFLKENGEITSEQELELARLNWDKPS